MVKTFIHNEAVLEVEAFFKQVELQNNVRHSYKLLEAMTEPLDEEPVASWQ